MITIAEKEIYYSPLSLKATNSGSDEVRVISTSDIIFYMGEEVEFGEDLTFGRLFEILIFHKEFFNILFNSELNHLTIDDFINDFVGDYDLVVSDEDFKIRLSWVCNYYSENDGPDFFDYIAFDGYGKLHKEDKFEYAFSVCFYPLYELKNKLVVCDNIYEVDEFTTDDMAVKQAFIANYKPFTLYGVISSIIREIAYYGIPEDRDKKRDEYEYMLMQIGPVTEQDEQEYIDEIKESIDKMIETDFNEEDRLTFWDMLYPKDEPTGKSSQEVIDDTIIALSESADIPLDEQLKEAVDNEEYEKAARIQRLIQRRDEKNKRD
jgi:hypothetical protein